MKINHYFTVNSVTTTSKYFENLDGLRFFAFLTVLVSHAALFLGYENSSRVFSYITSYILVNGDVGVSFFFVLSGFLITHLLFNEQNKNGGISLRKFYARRILRIWPVYFLTLIIGFFILPHFVQTFASGNGFPFSTNPPHAVLPWYLFFLANFNLAFHGGASVPTDVLWSISVEEQFYLIWPWIMLLLPRKYLAKFLGCIILVSTLYKYSYALFPDVLAYSTFSVMSYLAIGALLAWVTHTKPSIVQYVRELPTRAILAAYGLLPVLIFGRHYVDNVLISYPILYAVFVSILPLLLGLLFAFIILEQNVSVGSFYKTGRSKIFGFFGKISYGLYSYHMVAFAVVMLGAFRFGLVSPYASTILWLLLFVFSFVTVLILATVSYIAIEKQFLKRKPK
ncbi:MAG: acyltransferase [Patescibacteria group bacterium]